MNNPKKSRCQWLYRVMVAGVQLVQVDSIYFEDATAAIKFVNDIARTACEQTVTKEEADKMKIAHQIKFKNLYEMRLEDSAWNDKALDEPAAKAKANPHGVEIEPRPKPKANPHGLEIKPRPKPKVQTTTAATPPMVYKVNGPDEKVDKGSAKTSNGYAKGD